MRARLAMLVATLSLLGMACNSSSTTTVEGFASLELMDGTVTALSFNGPTVLPDEDATLSSPVVGYCVLSGTRAFVSLERYTSGSDPTGLETLEIDLDGHAPASVAAVVNGQTFEGDCEVEVYVRRPGAGRLSFATGCVLLGAAPDTVELSTELAFEGCQ